MKKDSKGLPDVCREGSNTIDPATIEFLNFYKVQTNALIEQCKILQLVQPANAETGRHLSLAISAYEEACMWAVKGLTAEGWKP